jgi:multicomponent Na+:H+ antiporter subunit D
MNTLTIVWIALPFFLGFIISLVPKLDRVLALAGALASAGFAAQLFLVQSPVKLQLLDSFGVTLEVDQLSGFFILTNALVTAAVIIYCWKLGKSAFFYAQAIILHGSLNAAFACTDFVSLYVALEVSGIASFLLIAYPRTDRTIWVALRYLFLGNVAMLFYLVGAVLVYQTHHSFNFAGLKGAPPEALALIFLGLLSKGGVFVTGLWLPMTHSESETPVSALLSGAVVKAGVYPLVRCALMVEEIDPIVRMFGVGTVLLGLFYALFEKDTKRVLASSTVAQLGWILAAPQVGGFYALAHGLVKAALFFIAGALPSRNFEVLQQKKIRTSLWVALLIASLSISGFPLLVGFGSKVLTFKALLPWQEIVMSVAAVGTAIVYARFIFLLPGGEEGTTKPGFWLALTLLIGGLVAASGFYLEAYTVANLLKALAIVGAGWLVYLVIFRRFILKLPQFPEQFEQLIGMMSVMLVLLFWMVFP